MQNEYYSMDFYTPEFKQCIYYLIQQNIADPDSIGEIFHISPNDLLTLIQFSEWCPSPNFKFNEPLRLTLKKVAGFYLSNM